jgi:hypothetical protein
MPDIDSNVGERIIRAAQRPAFFMLLIVASTLTSIGSPAASHLIDLPAEHPPTVDALHTGPAEHGAPIPPPLSGSQSQIPNEYWRTFDRVLSELNQSAGDGTALNPPTPVPATTPCAQGCSDPRAEDPAPANSLQTMPEESEMPVAPPLPDQSSAPPTSTTTPYGAQPTSDIPQPSNSAGPPASVDAIAAQPPTGTGAGPAPGPAN